MRVAVVSDIHGNLTALEAVLADLRRQAPDVVYQVGDLATHGHRPAEVVDHIRDLGWRGVLGNTDEMLWRADQMPALIERAPKLKPLFERMFNHLAPATCDLLGADRLAWLQQLPLTIRDGDLALLHASPANLWRAPMADASDQDLHAAYDSLDARMVVYGHIHTPYGRSLGDLTVANTGSVGMSFDGDPSASYLLIDDGHCHIRRVEYDVEREIRDLLASGYPLADWIAPILRTARFSQPA